MTEYNSESYLKKLDKWWRAATYLGAGMIFLKENPLFSVTGTPIKAENLKANPIGHWGTVSGQTFLYAHANRLINKLNSWYLPVITWALDNTKKVIYGAVGLLILAGGIVLWTKCRKR